MATLLGIIAGFLGGIIVALGFMVSAIHEQPGIRKFVMSMCQDLEDDYSLKD